MSELLTRKSNRQVVIEPLDGSNRRFVLYGLTSERPTFRVAAPTRRTVSEDTITQQRRRQPKKYTLDVVLWEPSVTTRPGGNFYNPGSSAIYEEGVDSRLTARQQLAIVDELAKLQDEGVLFRYSGIAIEVPICSLLEFDASLVYVSGRASLTLEERPETRFSLSELVIEAAEIEDAIKNLQGTGPLANNDLDALDKLQNDTMTEDEYRNLIRSYMVDDLKQEIGPIVRPTTDPDLLRDNGLDCLPIFIVNTSSEVRQVLPQDPSRPKPAVSVIPLSTLERPTRKGVSGFFKRTFGIGAEIHFTVFHAGAFIKFRFDEKNIGRSWKVRAEVYIDRDPAREDEIRSSPPLKLREDADCAEPAARAAKTAAEATKDEPFVAADGDRVVYGREWELTSTSTFTFVGPGGKNPFEGRTNGEISNTADPTSVEYPRRDEINQYTLVMADYR